VSAAGLLLAAALLAPGSPRRAGPAPDPPPASGPEERAARIDVALGSIHGSPSPAFWRALGPEAVPELARVARDPGAMPDRRARAATGLSHLGWSEAEAALRRLAAGDGEPFSVRAAALEGLGRLLPPAELARALRPVLEAAPRPVDRAVAAEVLADRAPDSGCRAVRARVARERERDRGAFGRALSLCGAVGR
jgi:hypothetical protein